MAVRQSEYLDETEFNLRGEVVELGNVSRTRLRAFATGRTLAYQALESLGEPNLKILRGTNGEPLWPTGYVGSITHKSGSCIAVAATTRLVSGLGIDLETDEPLDAQLWRKLANAAELDQSAIYPDLSIGNFVNVLFSAKESVFKCQSLVTGRHDLNHRQICLTFARRSQSFTGQIVVAPEDSARLDVLVIQGKFLISGGFVVTSAVLVDRM